MDAKKRTLDRAWTGGVVARSVGRGPQAAKFLLNNCLTKFGVSIMRCHTTMTMQAIPPSVGLILTLNIYHSVQEAVRFPAVETQHSHLGPVTQMRSWQSLQPSNNKTLFNAHL